MGFLLQTQMIGELGEKIGTTIVKMEALGNEGKVEEAMELSKTIEEYKRKKRDLEVKFICVIIFFFSYNLQLGKLVLILIYWDYSFFYIVFKCVSLFYRSMEASTAKWCRKNVGWVILEALNCSWNYSQLLAD